MNVVFANKPTTEQTGDVSHETSAQPTPPKELESPPARREFDLTSIDLQFYERMRIINPDSEHGRIFQRDCQALIARMYPRHDFEKTPVAFVLFESKNPNGFFDGLKSSTPLIGISTSFFKASFRDGRTLAPLLSTVDSLAAVLAHEWKHFELRGLRNNERPTMPEEAQCQYESVVALLDAGFDPRAELRLAKELAAR